MPSEPSPKAEVSKPKKVMRLHTRIIRFMMLVLLVPAVGIPLLTLTYLRYHFIGGTIRDSERQAVQHARFLESTLETRAVEVLMVSQFPEMRKYINARTGQEQAEGYEALIRRLRAYMIKQPDLFAGIRLFDVRGGERVNLRADTLEDQRDLGAEFSGEPWFMGAVHLAAIRGQTVPIHIAHPEVDGPLFYSSLIMDDDGVIAGVLLLEIRLDALLNTLRNGGPGRLCQVFDAAGQAMMPNGADPVLTQAGNWEDCPELVPLEMERILTRPSGVLPAQGLFPSQTMVHARIRPLGQSVVQWTALYQVSLTGVDQVLMRAVWIVCLFTLTVVIFAVLLALYLSRQITHPITKLVTAAGDLCHGYWDTLLPETAYQDEVHELTLAFATMSRQLRGAQENLLRKIEDLRASESKFAQEKERLMVTLRSIGDAVVTTDLQGHIELVNPLVSDMLGKDPGDISGKPFGELVRLHNHMSGERVENPVSRILSNEVDMIEHHDLLLLKEDGTDARVEINAKPIRNLRSEVVGVVFVIRDVSAIREIQMERARLDKLQSLGVLAGGIAHDFNNLISVAMGDLSLMHEAPEASQNPELLSDALKALDRARALTRQLLTFSKGGTPVKSAADLGELLEETARFALHGSACSLELSLSDDLWRAEVDPDQIHQVFHNLALNAVQAMPDGGVLRIEAGNVNLEGNVHPGVKAGPYVLIRVQDEGEGISDEDLEDIFDPYFTTKSSGNGLGLASVYSIIKAHEGHITVQSSRKEGSLFAVYLPALDQDVPTAQEPLTSEVPLPKEHLRILFLDDEPAIQMTCGRLLQYLGHQVDICSTGEEAIGKYRAAYEAGTPYDLLMVDLTIPGGKGGVAVVEEVRTFDPHVQAIVSSGYSQDPIMADFRKYGFVGMIQKPYTLDELKKCLRDLHRQD